MRAPRTDRSNPRTRTSSRRSRSPRSSKQSASPRYPSSGSSRQSSKRLLRQRRRNEPLIAFSGNRAGSAPSRRRRSRGRTRIRADRPQCDGGQAPGRRAGQGTPSRPLRRPVAAATRLRRGERAPAEPGATAGRVRAPGAEASTRAERFCGAYKGPPLAWKIAACTAPDGTHWALQAWQRMLPNYGVPATGDRAAWELRLSHWSGALPVLEIWTTGSVPPLPPPLRTADLRRRRRLRLQVDPLRRSPRHVREEHLRRHVREHVRRRVEAREQLPDTQANRSVLLRVLSARPKSDRRREEVPGDRDRPRRRARRDVGRTCTAAYDTARDALGKHCSARGARCRPALQDQLSLTPSPKDSPNAMPGSGRNPGRWSTARDRAGGRAPRAVHRGRGDR